MQKWIAALRDDYEVSVSLPKFTFTSQTDLKNALSLLGMPAAFSDQAEFPGISAQKEQKLYDALHQAFVEVNEERGLKPPRQRDISGATCRDRSLRKLYFVPIIPSCF